MQKDLKGGNFVVKLNFLLSTPQYKNIIRWDRSETMIDILNEQKMENQIIPIYFRHSKFQSFVRQLNLYGFKKVKHNDRQRFTHMRLLNGQKLVTITSNKAAKANKAQSSKAKNSQKGNAVMKVIKEQSSFVEPLQNIQNFHKKILTSNNSINNTQLMAVSVNYTYPPFYYLANNMTQLLSFENGIDYYNLLIPNEGINFSPSYMHNFHQ